MPFNNILKLLFIIVTLGMTNCSCTTSPTSEINDTIHITNINILDANCNSTNIDKKYLLGKFNPALDTAFIKVDNKYSYSDIYIRKPVYSAFKIMAEDALKDDVVLVIVSGTRTFNRQKNIWENKWTGKTKVNGKNLNIVMQNSTERAIEILKYSSMPGISRHHWGTDVDINSTNISYFQKGTGKKVFEWLEQNANKYGFYRPYTEKNQERPNGYEEEFWHWSYIPLSSIFLKNYLEIIKYDDLTGFKGAETAKKINVIEYYVKGINKSCF